MLTSLSCIIDDLSEINKKISFNELSEKFPNTYQLFNKDFNKFTLLLKNAFIPTNAWITGKDLMRNHYQIKNIFTVN